jgi:7-cyano-7-deazaguanine synthase in queuosine biosynthesis
VQLLSRNFARRKVETVSKAVVLLSGGLDSATMLAIARYEGFEPCAITFRYGQRHAVEIEAARRLVKTMNIAEHLEVEFDLRAMGGSALTSSIAVPKGGLQLNVDYSLTCSCYDPDGTGRACGHCDACSLRLEGFRENGIADPVAYQE